MAATEHTRRWRPGTELSLGRMLLHRRRGPGDPTYRVEGRDESAAHWRAFRTPEGAATLLLRASGGVVEASAWGSGADWALASVPGLLGEHDDPSGFAPEHPVLREAVRAYGPPRVGASGLVFEALVPAIIEQKVTGQEAFAGFRRLVRRFGERAPGPHPDLWVMPGPDVVRQVPSWEWLAMSVDHARSRALVTAARVADALERTVGLPGDEVERRLTSLPGIGEWTSAEVRQRAHGDPDAVSFGDYHVAKDVGWALTGQPWTDDELRTYLEPLAPHRGRVPRLIATARLFRPRHGARMAPRTHLPVTGR